MTSFNGRHPVLRQGMNCYPPFSLSNWNDRFRLTKIITKDLLASKIAGLQRIQSYRTESCYNTLLSHLRRAWVQSFEGEEILCPSPWYIHTCIHAQIHSYVLYLQTYMHAVTYMHTVRINKAHSDTKCQSHPQSHFGVLCSYCYLTTYICRLHCGERRSYGQLSALWIPFGDIPLLLAGAIVHEEWNVGLVIASLLSKKLYCGLNTCNHFTRCHDCFRHPLVQWQRCCHQVPLL